MPAYSSSTLCSFFFFFLIPPTLALTFIVNSDNNFTNLDIQGNFVRAQSNIQLRANDPETALPVPNVGRAIYGEPLHLWDDKSGNITDFSTNFNFTTEIIRPGGGLCFFIAPNGSTIPDGSSGGGLGLVSSSQINSPDDQSDQWFVAVEFDSYNDVWERSVSTPHIGLDINSVISIKTTEWFNDSIFRADTEAWITYNSRNKTLSVGFTRKPTLSDDQSNGSLSYEVDLTKYLPQYVMVGISASIGNSYDTYLFQNWSFASSDLPINDDSTEVVNNTTWVVAVNGVSGERRTKKGVVVGLSLGLLVLIGLIFALALLTSRYLKKKNIRRNGSPSDQEEEDLFNDSNMDDEFEKGSGPKKFSYTELALSTDNFSEKEKLGEGGFGQVYRGFLTETNSYIAVKRLSGRTHQGLKEYASEVKIISKLRHKNLVQFIGWCHRRGDLLLVYEYMSNRSLDYHLFGRDLIPLSWEVRYKIALGLASALLYLHQECEQCVLHRDIKSSNIMLDSSFNAKLGDFGLARLVDHEKGSQTTLVAGTRGYMAPETFTTGRASKESDVYSFGVVLLEIASGKRPVEVTNQQVVTTLIEYVWNLYGMGKLLDAADPKLCDEFDAIEMETLMVVGLWCVHPDSRCRPMIREAKHVLNFEATLPKIPRTLPPVMYYTPTPDDGSGRTFTLTGSSGGGQISTSTSTSLLSPR